ncbi:hypothetical protein D7V97_10055 [Corallococcus sp. CA053C]|uniref:hypothetical protein n=1 Tax=Corallococcus sp. CA053C TaxID=2316732 RepID=UPI000EA070B3|nr:hypothetical protein [Corallococcus sp. CA053C]RKH11878.1 hypothetical protein D7V97_10055 [Corallococcus sp. CA053C]
MSRIQPDFKSVLLLFTLGLMGAVSNASAQGPGGLTGVYSKDGGALAIVEGSNETLVHYSAGFPQGDSVGTCDCALVVQRKTSTRWTLNVAGETEPWTLRVEPQRLVLETKAPGCCGAGYPGKDSFTRGTPQPLTLCKVKASKAGFFASDAANTPRKTFVVSGDAVEAYLDPVEPDLIPARFQGPQKATVGLIKRADLDCVADTAAPKTAQAPVAADKLQPFAGTWVELTRKGKGFVILKPCSAKTRSFTLKPATGEVEVQLGQEATTLKVTSLTAGKGAGAWVLGLTSAEGKPEALQWKTADAAKGTVSVTSPDLFSQSHDYVRQEKQSAFPVKQETGCDEYEQ